MRNIMALAAIGLWACGGNNVSVNNDNPTGTVGIVVWDAATQMPISGAMVTILSGSTTKSGMTAMDGTYSTDGVPAGTLVITVGAGMYQTVTFQSTLSGSVGNFPVNHPTTTVGPIGLVRNDGTFTVRVVDENGAPANGIKLFARPQVSWVNFAFGFPQPNGSYEVTGMSDMNGLVTFMGIPNYAVLGGAVPTQILVDVPPTQVMGSNGYSFLGLTQSFDGLTTFNQTPTIVLAGPQTPLTVLNSNIDYLRTSVAGVNGAVINANGPITIAFNQAIDVNSVRVSFQNGDSTTSNIMAMSQANTNLLTITPSMGFTAGARYNLLLHVASATSSSSAARQINIAAPFFIAQSAPLAISSAIMDATTKTLKVTFNQAIGFGSGNASPQTCVAWYEGQVTLDNGMNMYAGEWPSGGGAAAIQCPPKDAPVGALDVTLVSPLEMVGPITGFSTVWSAQPDDGTPYDGCDGAITQPFTCRKAVVTDTVHLVFSRVKPSLGTIHLVDGAPAPDVSHAITAN